MIVLWDPILHKIHCMYLKLKVSVSWPDDGRKDRNCHHKNKEDKTKYIVVFGGSYKQFIYLVTH